MNIKSYKILEVLGRGVVSLVVFNLYLNILLDCNYLRIVRMIFMLLSLLIWTFLPNVDPRNKSLNMISK